MKDVSSGDVGFASDLYGVIKGQTGNLFVSPTSVRTAMALAYAGARGETAKELERVLRLPARGAHEAFAALLADWNARAQVAVQPGADEWEKETAERNRLVLRVVNRLWGAKGRPFAQEFLSILKEKYGAPLEALDFAADPEAARRRINAWVEEQTESKIRELLASGIIHKLTGIVLTNAVYFKARWTTEFEEGATKDGPFHAQTGEVKAPLMRKTAYYAYAETGDVKLVELPYGAGDLNMLVVLPRERGMLQKVEQSISEPTLQKWMAAPQPEELDLTFPRFGVESSFQLREPLSGMGIKTVFQPDQADFSGMDGTRELVLQDVIHKTYVKVDERGTEAAAATALAVETLGMPRQPREVRVDHPFLFLIVDKRNSCVLFMGRLLDPTR
jgi:serpin B